MRNDVAATRKMYLTPILFTKLSLTPLNRFPSFSQVRPKHVNIQRGFSVQQMLPMGLRVIRAPR